MHTAETPVSDSPVALLMEGVRQRLILLTDEERGAYVGSDLPAVDRALACVQRDGLARGPVFCEWGSGLGGVCGVAAINGFTAHGIEIQQPLVVAARALALELNHSMVFAAGTFLRPGDEELADMAHSNTRLDFNEGAWEELGLVPEDCDVVFAYPWHDEEAFVDKIFSRHATENSLLLTYHDLGRVLAQRKVADDAELQVLGWI